MTGTLERKPRPRTRLLLAAVWTTALAVGVLPDLLGLDQRIPFAQLVAFRPWTAAGAAVFALLLGVLTVFRRGLWPVLAGTVAIVLVAAAMVLPRAVPGAVPGTGRSLTIAVANVYLGQADPAAVAALVRDHRPDVVALPEAAEPVRGPHRAARRAARVPAPRVGAARHPGRRRGVGAGRRTGSARWPSASARTPASIRTWRSAVAAWVMSGSWPTTRRHPPPAGWRRGGPTWPCSPDGAQAPAAP